MSEKERLKLLGESVRAAYLTRLRDHPDQTSLLKLIAAERKIQQILLVSAEGIILADSKGESERAERVHADGEASRGRGDAPEGETV
ncbi:MAG TPA: hypothetical protein VI382_07780, partial [Candidatus Manganitrophaceae bacterium]|nr:hypothetical protein [Candidatus Manganitrophaceae bacterium]